MGVGGALAKVPILLDTDIGTNVDDALALAYLLGHADCELLGISTVSGDVRRRAACAEALCEAAGREPIPIHCGSPGPLLTGPGQPAAPLYESVKHRRPRLDRDLGTAVEFLRATVRSRPNEITLLTIGPLTNVALLFALDPEVPSLLKAIVSMAGVYFPHERPVETNVLTDPVAAAIVFRATARPHAPPHLLVGLNVTTRCTMTVDDLRKRLRGAPPPADVLLEMLESWQRRKRHVTFNDPLAAAVALRPELCTWEPGAVMMNVAERGDAAAHTFFAPARDVPQYAGSQRVAKGVRVAPFFEEFFAAIRDGAIIPPADDARGPADDVRPRL